jgi:hypothetical protein
MYSMYTIRYIRVYIYILNVCVGVHTHIYLHIYNTIQYNTILYTHTVTHTHSHSLTHNIIEYNKSICCITREKVLGFSSSASRGRASIRGALLSARLRYGSESMSLLYVLGLF